MVSPEIRKEARLAIEQEEEAKNRGFKQVYPKAWRTLRVLAQERSTVPLRLWTWIAEMSGPDSTLCVRQQDMATELGVSVRQIQRALDVLEEKAGLVAFKEFGLSVYAIDPYMVWASWSQAQHWAPFKTKTLVPKTSKEGDAFARRLAVLMRRVAQDDGPIAVPAAFKSMDEAAEVYEAEVGSYYRERQQEDADIRKAEKKAARLAENRDLDRMDNDVRAQRKVRKAA